MWCYFVVVAVSRGLHRQRSEGDVIPSSAYKDRVASGVIVDLRGIGDCRYDYTNHVQAGTFPA